MWRDAREHRRRHEEAGVKVVRTAATCQQRRALRHARRNVAEHLLVLRFAHLHERPKVLKKEEKEEDEFYKVTVDSPPQAYKSLWGWHKTVD